MFIDAGDPVENEIDESRSLDAAAANEDSSVATEIDGLVSEAVYLEQALHLPDHLKCSAHRLNLVASKDATDGLTNPGTKRLYRGLLAKLQTIWNTQNR